MDSLRGSSDFNVDLYSLACQPHSYNCYSRCDVNGVKFVTVERDTHSTQNSGVMVQTDDANYYGYVEDIVELKYPQGVSVVVFKCRWFKSQGRNRKIDHGLVSLDTSTSWYEDSPFCLASTARQVFFIDDPNMGGNWKVVCVASQRGIYNANSLERGENSNSNHVECAYQEDTPMNILDVSIESLYVDLGCLPHASNNDIFDAEDDDDHDEEQNISSEEEGNIEDEAQIDDYNV